MPPPARARARARTRLRRIPAAGELCPCWPPHYTTPFVCARPEPKGKKGGFGEAFGPGAVSMTVTGLGAAMGVGAAVWYLRKKKQFERQEMAGRGGSIPVYHVVGVDERVSLLQSHDDAGPLPPKYGGGGGGGGNAPPSYGIGA